MIARTTRYTKHRDSRFISCFAYALTVWTSRMTGSSVCDEMMFILLCKWPIQSGIIQPINNTKREKVERRGGGKRASTKESNHRGIAASLSNRSNHRLLLAIRSLRCSSVCCNSAALQLFHMKSSVSDTKNIRYVRTHTFMPSPSRALNLPAGARCP